MKLFEALKLELKSKSSENNITDSKVIRMLMLLAMQTKSSSAAVGAAGAVDADTLGGT